MFATGNPFWALISSIGAPLFRRLLRHQQHAAEDALEAAKANYRAALQSFADVSNALTALDRWRGAGCGWTRATVRPVPAWASPRASCSLRGRHAIGAERLGHAGGSAPAALITARRAARPTGGPVHGAGRRADPPVVATALTLPSGEAGFPIEKAGEIPPAFLSARRKTVSRPAACRSPAIRCIAFCSFERPHLDLAHALATDVVDLAQFLGVLETSIRRRSVRMWRSRSLRLSIASTSISWRNWAIGIGHRLVLQRAVIGQPVLPAALAILAWGR
jgi:hypothetical protein